VIYTLFNAGYSSLGDLKGVSLAELYRATNVHVRAWAKILDREHEVDLMVTDIFDIIKKRNF
jgi:hypothetical protein